MDQREPACWHCVYASWAYIEENKPHQCCALGPSLLLQATQTTGEALQAAGEELVAAVGKGPEPAAASKGPERTAGAAPDPPPAETEAAGLPIVQ